MRASRPASLGAGAERLVDDGLDGARATAALCSAAEAAINLLGATGKRGRRIHYITNIMVAEDVTETNNHENEQAFRVMRNSRSYLDGAVSDANEKPHFQVIPN